MPAFGTKAPLAVPGIGPLMPHNEQTVERHKQRERSRTTPRPRQKSIRDYSQSRMVFIYNVGPFSASIPAASLGPQYIPALPADKVLLPDDLSVAGPLAIEGNPAEPYPDEGRGKWIEHDPAEHIGFSDWPGYHLALTLLGAAPQSNPEDNLVRKGLFVSPIPEQAKPGVDASDEARAMYDQWKELVIAARDAFSEYAEFECGRANEAHSKQRFGEIRGDDDHFHICAKILRKSVVDCPWLGTSAENVQRRACRECGSTMLSSVPRCPACKALQMSPAAYKKWLAAKDAAQDDGQDS